MRPAGVLTADYQQRVLATAIAVMRTELPRPGYDRVQILILANNLAALLNQRQAVDDEMHQARAEFTRACAVLIHQGVIVVDGAHWIDADLVCDLDLYVHTVRIPAGTTGPWQRVRAAAPTVQSLADRCADRSPAGATTQVRGRDDTFDLIVAHPDGHLTIRLLPSDNDGRYLLTGISWSPPGDAENRPHDTEQQAGRQRPDSPPPGAAPDGSRTADPGPPIALAEINTGHYTFHAFGATPEQARDALMTAWLQHVADTGADLDCFARKDINVTRADTAAPSVTARRTREP